MNPSLALVVGILPLFLGGSAPHGTDSFRARPDSLFHFVRPAMGTTAEVFLYASSRGAAEALSEVAFTEIGRIESALSSFRPTSEVSRINREAAQGPVTTDPEVFALLRLALSISERTGGAFDITVGPLMRAWRGSGDSGLPPPEGILSQALARTGWHRVALDPGARSVRFLDPGVEMDLGGIGKGWALDQAAAKLRSLGVKAALLGLGRSSYLAVGAPPGKKGWPVSIQDPERPGRVLSSVQLRDRALSTSGNSERYFERNGRRFSHILDPRTGHPVTTLVQATVTAPTATECDALSTALFVIGIEGAEDVLYEAEAVRAYLVDRNDGETSITTVRWAEPSGIPQPALLERTHRGP